MARGLHVDAGECTGCEYCADSLPEVFRLDDEGISAVHDPDGAAETRIQNVIDNCPAGCIQWSR